MAVSPPAADSALPAECADLLRRARELLRSPPAPRLSALAIELSRAAWKLAPGHPKVAACLARSLYVHGLGDEATAVCDSCLAEHPEALEMRVQQLFASIPALYTGAEQPADARRAYEHRLTELERHVHSASNEELIRFARQEGQIFPSWLPYQAEDDAPLQRRLGVLLRRAVATAYRDRALEGGAPAESRLRIGFVSGHFWGHTVWHVVIKGWLAGLRARGFECYGYAVDGPEDGETETARALCRRFVSGERPLEQWADEIAADRPHVIIYPALSYSGVCDRLALLRLAPVQCTTFGECETSGSPVMDWYLGSDLMEPADGEGHYTERLARLPDLALSYPGRQGTPSGRGREHQGLRPDAVLFVSPHLLVKYLPRYDDLYARVAAEMPDAQLVFFKDWRVERASRVVSRRLEEAFAERGLDPGGRLVFLDRLSRPDYLSLLQVSDVYLDVPGWNGGTTTAEALAWHLPVVTLEGRLARSRMGAAMLRHVGITDGLAHSEDEYVQLAVGLGRDASRRADLRRRLGVSSPRISDDAARLDGLASFLRAAVEESC